MTALVMHVLPVPGPAACYVTECYRRDVAAGSRTCLHARVCRACSMMTVSMVDAAQMLHGALSGSAT